jgi:hypothetical protein
MLPFGYDKNKIEKTKQAMNKIELYNDSTERIFLTIKGIQTFD